MKQAFIILIVIALIGCAPKNQNTQDGKPDAPAPQPTETKSASVVEKAVESVNCTIPKMDSCGDELQAVARCLHEAVTLLQKEPDEDGLVPFLMEAIEQAGKGDVVEPCASLGLTAECDTLQLSTGDEIAWEKKNSSHDNFGGGAMFHIVYTFSAESCPDDAEIEIQLKIGDVI